MKVRIINHPAQTAATVCFLMQMSHGSKIKAMERKVSEAEMKLATLKRENDALTCCVKDLEGKNSHVQSTMDKLYAESKKKGWFK